MALSGPRWRVLWLRSGGNLISTDYVIDETLTLIRMRLGLRAAARWWKQIDASSRLRWEWIYREDIRLAGAGPEVRVCPDRGRQRSGNRQILPLVGEEPLE